MNILMNNNKWKDPKNSIKQKKNIIGQYKVWY